MSDTGVPTIGQMIDKYKELETYIEAEEAAYAERMKPYTTAIATIKNACLAELQRTGQQNAKSENGGTAYQQEILSVKVDNQDTLFDYVSKSGNWAMVTLAPVKDAVKQYREAHAADPPGIISQPIVKCNIRRT